MGANEKAEPTYRGGRHPFVGIDARTCERCGFREAADIHQPEAVELDREPGEVISEELRQRAELAARVLSMTKALREPTKGTYWLVIEGRMGDAANLINDLHAELLKAQGAR